MQVSQIIVVTILLLAIIANILIAALVYLGNRTSISHRYFAVFAIAVSSWVVTNTLFVVVDETSRYPVALASYASALVLATALLLFSIHFTGTRTTFMAKLSIVTVGVVASIFAAWPGVVATGVEELSITTNQLALLIFGLVLLLLLGSSLWVLIRSYIKSKGIERKRILAFLLGLGGAMALGVSFNLILPLFGKYSFVQAGPSATLLLVAGSAYAIIRHGLFDIRLAVARVLSYSFSVILIAVLYVLVVFNLFSILLPESHVAFGQGVIYIIFAIGAALTFQPVKRFFDTVTDRIFFKGEYDLKETLDKLGHSIISHPELNDLLNKSTQVLYDALRPTYVKVYIQEGSEFVEFGIGNESTIKEEDLKYIVRHSATPVFIDTRRSMDAHLRNIFQKEGIAVTARLQTTHGVLGVLVIGLKRNADTYSPKDANLVSVGIDELAVAIENALRFEEIQNFNETLQDKVDAATRRLRKANERLRQLDATKDEFVSMASHQLRTPLTSVKGYLSMVLEGDAGKLNPTQEKLLKEAFTSSERMVRLIGDFLNVSRLRTGKFVIERKPVNMAELVKGEVTQLKPTAEARELSLTYEQPKDFPEMDIDKSKIQQVVMNFLDNAIFYSKPGGKITVELYQKQNDIIFKVKDQGIGVPDDEKKRLFTKFYRASNARKQRPDGTGIGLFMAQKVIIAHGGAVIFESKEGEGSTFGFRLPLKLSAADKERAESVTNEMNLLEGITE